MILWYELNTINLNVEQMIWFPNLYWLGFIKC